MSEESVPIADIQTATPSPPNVAAACFSPNYSTPQYNSPQYTTHYTPHSYTAYTPHASYPTMHPHRTVSYGSPKTSPSCSRKTSVESAPATLDNLTPPDTRPAIEASTAPPGIIAPAIMLFEADRMLEPSELESGVPRKQTGTGIWKGKVLCLCSVI